LISSMMWMNGGCMWPSSGSACAAKMRGCAVVGPGPMSSLEGTCMQKAVQYSLIMLSTVTTDTEEAVAIRLQDTFSSHCKARL
jgi:hypothetical protein